VDTSAALPVFRYHRDPLKSGSVIESQKKCKCCRKARGYLYAGPVYAEDELEESICPWCIADGAAHEKWDASFVDEAALPDGIPRAVVEEVAWRTPGYSSWQQEQWFACCKDAVAFLEPVGIKEIRESYQPLEFNVLSNIIHDLHVSGGAATRMLETLDRNAGPTAYLFQCSHCGVYKTFVDGIFDLEE
jgi:uncharacterized protein CbrC (UPF0167 family)